MARARPATTRSTRAARRAASSPGTRQAARCRLMAAPRRMRTSARPRRRHSCDVACAEPGGRAPGLRRASSRSRRSTCPLPSSAPHQRPCAAALAARPTTHQRWRARARRGSARAGACRTGGRNGRPWADCAAPTPAVSTTPWAVCWAMCWVDGRQRCGRGSASGLANTAPNIIVEGEGVARH